MSGKVKSMTSRERAREWLTESGYGTDAVGIEDSLASAFEVARREEVAPLEADRDMLHGALDLLSMRTDEQLRALETALRSLMEVYSGCLNETHRCEKCGRCRHVSGHDERCSAWALVKAALRSTPNIGYPTEPKEPRVARLADALRSEAARWHDERAVLERAAAEQLKFEYKEARSRDEIKAARHLKWRMTRAEARAEAHEETATALRFGERRPKDAAPAPARTVRVPNADGWWARRQSGKIKWFRVEMVSDSGEPPLTPHIYVSDLEEFVEAARFTTPLTRWFGPFVLDGFGVEG